MNKKPADRTVERYVGIDKDVGGGITPPGGLLVTPGCSVVFRAYDKGFRPGHVSGIRPFTKDGTALYLEQPFSVLSHLQQADTGWQAANLQHGMEQAYSVNPQPAPPL